MKMAQNKMEKDFSKKLNEREIQPSPMAWDRLDAMLAVAEGKTAKKKYNWLYVAAGFLGFLFIGTMLFTQTATMTDIGKEEVVIENNSRDSIIKNQDQKYISPVLENRTENTAVASEDKKIKSKATKTITNQTIEVNENYNQNYQENVIAENPIINQKTEQQSVKTPSYVNVDELLASVERTPKPAKPTIKIDANNLLSQVDGELELSFREKVIQTVNKQYKNVKVALSNRNVQN